jgi:serine protease AprX
VGQGADCLPGKLRSARLLTDEPRDGSDLLRSADHILPQFTRSALRDPVSPRRRISCSCGKEAEMRGEFTVRSTDQPSNETGATCGARRSRSRTRILAAATVATLAAGALGTAATAAAAESPRGAKTPAGQVVVFGCADPTGAVRAAGGSVTADLSLISGVAAQLPAGVHLSSCSVAPNISLKVSGLGPALGKKLHAPPHKGHDTSTGDTSTGDTSTGDTSTGPGGGSANAAASTARQTLGLSTDSPSGRGITVAEVDTGVDDSPDLAGRVLHVDVTGTSRGSDHDDYGHATFVAGLIAGNGNASGGAYQGAAPDARLLDVRVAQDDGSTSLISVLRGLQFVSRSQNALNIRVLNLSLSSGSPLPYQIDPLARALEALWKRGIVVVVPAGNDGPGAGTISSPGNDPVLLTVGALDERGTAGRSDDAVADFSSRGPAAQGIGKPDLVAPGTHLVSLRAPGSVVDTQNPDSRIAGSYFRGSGTSMSTALTTGVVADLLSARPKLSPDQVKAMLTGSAYSGAQLADRASAGAGGLDAAAALAAATPIVSPVDTDASWPTGQDATWDRFSAAMLSGDRAAAYHWWTKLSPAARSWVARSWTQLSPDARSWVARSWVGRSWVGADGTADEWLARSWVARSWVARSWVGDAWTARSWVDLNWVARSWVARSWVARSWTARSWFDDDWSARSWTARSWTARSWTIADWS